MEYAKMRIEEAMKCNREAHTFYGICFITVDVVFAQSVERALANPLYVNDTHWLSSEKHRIIYLICNFMIL